VEIAAVMLPVDLPRARVAIGLQHIVHTAATIPTLDATLRTRWIDLVLLDPVALPPTSSTQLAACLASHTDIPVVGYVSVSPEGMRQAMALSLMGVRRIVLRGHDDQPAALRALLDSARADTLASQMVAAITPILVGLPDPLARAIEAVFREPQAFRTANDLARAAGLPPRTLSRVLARADLASPRAFVRAARVVRAYHALRAGHVRVRDIARQLGYGTPDALVRDTQHSTGLRPTMLVRRVSPDLLVKQVVRRLTVRFRRRPHLSLLARETPNARSAGAASLQPASA
jgi:AraC-like DNA-binding protein